MSYNRVIPCDLFNEAKLLKCLGQLSLVIHGGVGVPDGLVLEHEDPWEAFIIRRDDSSGALYCENLSCGYAGRLIGLRCPLNSKEAYPLFYVLDDQEDAVFKPDGTLSMEFLRLLNSITA